MLNMFLRCECFFRFLMFFTLVSGETLTSVKPRDNRFVGNAIIVTDMTPYSYLVGIIRSVSTLMGTGLITGTSWVLTSGQVAKAIYDAYHLDHYVKYNGLDISPTGTAKYRRVLIAVPHPGYTTKYKANNVGLLKVCPHFTSSVRAPLGQPPPVQAGQQGIVLGWGGNTNLKKLRYIAQTINTDLICNTTSAVNNVANKVYDPQNFCVVVNVGTAGCVGDYGSPFIISNKVVGILDQYACTNNLADTYTELLDYLPWITTQSAVL